MISQNKKTTEFKQGMVRNVKSKLREYARSWVLKHPRFDPRVYLRVFPIKLYRGITAPIRVLPDFVIIGVGKSGTTSLYDYIVKHPSIGSSLYKETKFLHYHSSSFLYRSYFPTIFTSCWINNSRGKKFLTGEATPSYFFYPNCGKKIFKINPNIKLILILRNPIDRAYSEYQAQVSGNEQNLSFELAIKNQEKVWLESENLRDNESMVKDLLPNLYLQQGVYIDKLKQWMKIFPKNQFLILRTEDLESNPTKKMNDVFEFLEVPSYKIKNFQKKNVGNYDPIKHETRKELIEFFKPYNEKLSKFLGQDFGWDK